MGRVLALDYGKKRIGIAVSDPLKMIANGLKTISSKDIWDFLDDYLKNEFVDTIVVGYPKQMDNTPSQSVEFIDPFVKELKQKYPEVVIELVDERFTSKMAIQAMIEGGLKKTDRQNKATIDRVSAAIILQSYLDMKIL